MKRVLNKKKKIILKIKGLEIKRDIHADELPPSIENGLQTRYMKLIQNFKQRQFESDSDDSEEDPKPIFRFMREKDAEMDEGKHVDFEKFKKYRY